MTTIKFTRASQPPAPTVDWSNPITRGLCVGIDAVSNRFFADYSSTLPVYATVHKPLGIARNFGPNVIAPAFLKGTTTASITMLQIGVISSNTAQTAPFTLSHNGTSNTFTIEHSDGVTAGKVRGRVYISGYSYCGGSVTLPLGATYVAVLRHTNGVGQALWLNGSKDSIVTSATGATLGNTWYGAYTAASELGLLNVVWNRALSDAEIKSLSNNPWQIFTPIERQIWVSASTPSESTGDLAASESGSDTAAFTGTSVTTFYGDLAVTEAGADTADLSGSALSQGSLTSTEVGSDTSAWTGVTLSQGNLAVSESGADTSALTGVVLSQGDLAATEPGSDTAAFTGSQETIAILAAVETGSDVASATGLTLVQGAIATSESGADTASVNGVTLVQGTLAASESGSDTAVFNAVATATATLAVSEAGSDTAVVSGATLVQGSINTSEAGSDTASITGLTYVVGILVTSESGSDVASFTGGNPAFYVPSLRTITSPARFSALSTSPSRLVDLSSADRTVTYSSSHRVTALASSPSRSVETFTSLSRSVQFTSPSRSIILGTSPSRVVSFTSDERSEV